MRNILLWIFLFFIGLPSGFKTLFLSNVKVGNSIFILFLFVSFFLFTNRKIYFKSIAFIGLLVLINLFSIPSLAPNLAGETMALTNNLIIILLLIIIVNSLSKSYNAALIYTKTAKAFIFSSVITGIIGLLQILTFLPDFESATGLGMMGHKNHFAYSIALGFILSIFTFLKENRILFLITSIFLFTAVLLAMSRGALLCVVVSFLCIYIYLYKMKIPHLIGLSLVLYIFYLLVTNIYEKQLNQKDVSSGRIELWAYFLPKSQDELIYGKGVGSTFKTKPTDINGDGGFVSETNNYVYTHNDYLFLLHDYGILIVILYFVLVVLINYKIINKYFNGLDKALFISLMLAFLIYQQFDTCFFGAHNFPIFYTICLLPLHLMEVLKSEKNNQLKKRTLNLVKKIGV